MHRDFFSNIPIQGKLPGNSKETKQFLPPHTSSELIYCTWGKVSHPLKSCTKLFSEQLGISRKYSENTLSFHLTEKAQKVLFSQRH